MTEQSDFPKKSSLPSNSQIRRNEPERKKVEKVISGEAKLKKKTTWDKIKETFTGDDARSVGAYLLYDVAIPAFKSFLAESAAEGANRLLFGSGGPDRSVRGSRRGGEYRSYNRMYRPSSERDSETRSLSRRDRATHNFDSIVLESRGEADEVLDSLFELVDANDYATVNDLYELVGITGDFTDEKWGWSNLKDARIRRVAEGHLVELPRPEPID